MRRILSESLYSQPGNMLISTLGGITASVIGAALARDTVLTAIATLVCLIAVLRYAAVLAVPRASGRMRAACRMVFELGAFAYASAVGGMAAYAILQALAPQVQIALIGFAIAYGAGISARNAGNPALAIGQLMLSIAIPVLALLLDDNPAGKLLAIPLAIMIPAMASVTIHINRVLRQSFAAAETSARLADKMKAIARRDVLTGLLNRAGLNRALADLRANLPHGRKLALFWIDLDKFKEVNDTLGHQTGDRLLVEISTRLRRIVPPGTTLARFGGDEFIIACETASRADVGDLAEAIMAEVVRPMRIDQHALEIGGSLGIAMLPDDGTDLDSLMQAADLALYHAKENGKRRASFFVPEMTRKLVRRREIEADLRHALQHDELSVYYQPIVDLHSGQIRSFEALARWFHPEKGEITPDEFIPVAEDSGAIITLGNWLTAKAAAAAAQWPKHITLAVNVSPLQTKAPGAALGILEALRQARLDPARLELEITESALLEDCPDTRAFINDLHGKGVRLALDDFGTGYSSLVTLNAYPFARIKVDRSFVSGIHTGRKSEAIIRGVSGMAATLGMEIVAEGVETLEQAHAVREAGCTLGQGWHYSRAIPGSLVTMLLETESLVSARLETNLLLKVG